MSLGSAEQRHARDCSADELSVARRVQSALSHAYGTFSVLLDADFTVIWASETAESIFGHDLVVGRPVTDFTHPDDLGLVLDAIDYHGRNATLYATLDRAISPDLSVVRIARDDGTWTTCEVTVFNHLDDTDVRAILAIGRVSHDRNDLAMVIEMLAEGANITEIMAVIADMVNHNIDAVRSQVFWREPGVETLQSARSEMPLPVPPDDVLSTVMASGEARTLVGAELLGHECVAMGFQALWVLPITSKSAEEAIGALAVWNRLPTDYVEGPHQVLTQAVRVASLTIVDHRSKQALRWDASHDALTLLDNRASFDRALGRQSGGCALIYIDLDDFKLVNDELGHAAGDEALIEAARRISEVVRSGDIVARVGGDEFAILCPGLRDIEIARQIGRRVISSVSRPIETHGRQVRIGASVGLALGDESHDPIRLFHSADMALYEAKRLGKSQLCLGS